jgi:hypothetical protein
MFQRILSVMANLVHEPRRSAPATRPTLEQLEDRCTPSMGMMQPMGMPMMGMPMMGMGMTGTSMMSQTPSPAAMAAFRQLVTDFDRSLQQVLSSQTRQQFVANETAMIQLVFMDIARFNMLLSPMGRTG